MHIYISWATGLLWSALTDQLLELGHQVTVISRSADKVHTMYGDTVGVITWSELDTTSMDWCEICIHLAGRSIISLPWSASNKKSIRDSRIHTTKHIVASLPSSCHTLICASATGYYPSSLTQLHTPRDINTDPSNFLSRLCAERELQALQARTDTRRVVMSRTWLVTGPGTFEDQIITSTKRLWWVTLWDGSQYMPLVTTSERVQNIVTCIQNKHIQWPINNVTINLTYSQYIDSIANKLHRPSRIKIPARLIKLILWEASILFLGSWKCEPFDAKK